MSDKTKVMDAAELLELDMFCAECVMGCKFRYEPISHTDKGCSQCFCDEEEGGVVCSTPYPTAIKGEFGHIWRKFSPTKNGTDALAVLGKCLSLKGIGDTCISKDGTKFWLRTVWEGRHCEGEAETLELAICLLAKKLWRYERMKL